MLECFRSIIVTGSTAVSAVISGTEGNRWLHTANIGDARIVLSRKGKAVRLSYDHKATDEAEKKRIGDMGGLIFMNKVAGSLIS